MTKIGSSFVTAVSFDGKPYFPFPILLLLSPYGPKNSGKDRLRVKLSTSLDTSDEQDSGIRYHKVCWVNNVANVLGQPDPGTTSNNDAPTTKKAAQTEFLPMTEINLREGKILTMSNLQAEYESILQANNQCQ